MGSARSGTKGTTNNPNGRPKGSQNRDVSMVREAVAKLLDDYTPKMHGWLDLIARENPEKAMTLVKDLLEYSIPKLARTEHTGANGGAIQQEMNVNVNLVKRES